MESILYYIEEKHYNVIDIKNDLTSIFFEKLKKERIINILKKDLNLCKFSFVGMISCPSLISIILPKYLISNDLSTSDKIIEAKLVLQVLRMYAKKAENEEDLSYLSLNSENYYFNMLAISDYLINDYLEYGIYFEDIDEINLNGSGEINWLVTIEQEPVYISNNQVIYLNYMTDSNESDKNTYISQVHKLVLNECINFMKKLEFLELFTCPSILFNIHKDSLGDVDFKIKKLNDQLSKSYSQRDIRLLKTVIQFLENSVVETNKNTETIYGIKRFEYVWEKITSNVIGNDYEELKDKIPKPIWEKKNPQPRYQVESNTLIPDILKIIGNELFIFDAKYYKPIFKNGSLKAGHPGVGDISKQYLYEQAFKYCGYHHIYNFLLIPCYSDKTNIIGKVVFPLFDNTEYGDIFLVDINTKILFNLYLDDKKYENTFFSTLVTEVY